jgi:hypothetical protein
MGKRFQVAYETGGYCKNICVWFDGTIRPMLGHHGKCRWNYDGQVFYHLTTPLNNTAPNGQKG